jgi:hypothetical protein
MNPVRVQRSRKAGWRKPENWKYVGKRTKYGNNNDWRIYGRAKAVELFIEQWKGREAEIAADLRGKNLGCYCPIGEPCHADWLLEVANR